jgi:lipid A 3-O-deacylase
MKTTTRTSPASAVVWRHAQIASCCLATLVLAESVQAADGLAPSRLFVQAGAAEQSQMLVFGAVWDWRWQKPLSSGLLTGYWEVSFGRWSSQADPSGSSFAWVTQLGVTPVLRWYPGAETARWFVEAGVGANVLAPIYRSRNKRFSTEFNFGDHLAVGWHMGAGHQHEISLRVQHFSNAGIKHPNPGENFLQLRYVARY